MGEKYCSLVVSATCPSAFFYYIELLFENLLEVLGKCTSHLPLNSSGFKCQQPSSLSVGSVISRH